MRYSRYWVIYPISPICDTVLHWISQCLHCCDNRPDFTAFQFWLSSVNTCGLCCAVAIPFSEKMWEQDISLNNGDCFAPPSPIESQAKWLSLTNTSTIHSNAWATLVDDLIRVVTLLTPQLWHPALWRTSWDVVWRLLTRGRLANRCCVNFTWEASKPVRVEAQ